jgi:hypothetical protein
MVDSDGDLEIWWMVICAAAPAAYVVDMEREYAQLQREIGAQAGKLDSMNWFVFHSRWPKKTNQWTKNLCTAPAWPQEKRIICRPD